MNLYNIGRWIINTAHHDPLLAGLCGTIFILALLGGLLMLIEKKLGK